MPKLDLSCPVCDSQTSKKLSLIYEEGRSTAHSTSHSVGRTNTISQIKITTTGQTYGVHQSDASKSAAPPSVPVLVTEGESTQKQVAYGGGTLLALVASYIAHTHGSGLFAIWLIVVASFIAALIVGCLVSAKATPAEIEQHAKDNAKEIAALKKWEQTFLCGSCGHRFVPASTIATS